MIRQTHIFIWFLQFPRYLQLQPPLLQFTLFVQTLLIPFFLPQAFTLLESPKFKGALGKKNVCVCVCEKTDKKVYLTLLSCVRIQPNAAVHSKEKCLRARIF